MQFMLVVQEQSKALSASVAQWAPVMLEHAELAEALDDFAGMRDALHLLCKPQKRTANKKAQRAAARVSGGAARSNQTAWTDGDPASGRLGKQLAELIGARRIARGVGRLSDGQARARLSDDGPVSLGGLRAIERPVEAGEDGLTDHLENLPFGRRAAVPVGEREVHGDEKPHIVSICGALAITHDPSYSR